MKDFLRGRNYICLQFYLSIQCVYPQVLSNINPWDHLLLLKDYSFVLNTTLPLFQGCCIHLLLCNSHSCSPNLSYSLIALWAPGVSWGLPPQALLRSCLQMVAGTGITQRLYGAGCFLHMAGIWSLLSAGSSASLMPGAPIDVFFM